MRKALVFWFSFLFILLWMTSCKSKKTFVEKEITKDSISVMVKDTTFTVAKDSSSYAAQLQVDTKGTISIKQVNETKPGRKLEAPKVTIKNNQLIVDCVAEAEKLFASWKETFIKSYKENQVPIITNELTWLQKTQIYIGRTLLAILVIWLLLHLFKFKQF